MLILCIAIARPVCRLLRGRVRLRTMSRDFYADDPTESEFPILCAGGGGGGRDRCETDGCIGTATAPGCFPPPPLPPSNKWPYMGGKPLCVL
ncbi:unnamed protein product [Dibothriocephalus latus]|uniref:Uncharacterized protein n=1 Tax=Dibothriocephalus latus TaxID=60516 RepID=A0A3P6PVV3_DIBLA|nr:unnamed protein product [Dibothriocephalus latus]